MPERVESRENGGSAGRTQRGGNQRILDVSAVRRQRIQDGRLGELMPQKTHGIITMIIGEDENDVAWLHAGNALRHNLRRHGNDGGQRWQRDQPRYEYQSRQQANRLCGQFLAVARRGENGVGFQLIIGAGSSALRRNKI